MGGLSAGGKVDDKSIYHPATHTNTTRGEATANGATTAVGAVVVAVGGDSGGDRVVVIVVVVVVVIPCFILCR